MYSEIKRCRICGNTQLLKILTLGNQPQAGIFPLPNEEVEMGPLELVKCDDSQPQACGLVQLKHSFSPEMLYGQSYGYRSGLNRSMVQHLVNKAARAKKLAKLSKGDTVVDIGSNDGTFLKSFEAQEGLRLVGVDPTIKKFGQYYRSDIEKYPEFFAASTTQKILGSKKAKLITSFSMFYDLESPMEFVSVIQSSLDPEGVWVFEQSYLPLMLERNSYDTICHEHLEYYHLKPIMWMLKQAGLRIIDVELNDVNGGSISISATHEDAKSFELNKPALLTELLKKEDVDSLNTLKPYEAFRKRVESHREELVAELKRIKSEGKRVFGYGASTKGNVLLNYCELSPDLIECIAEVNVDKVGRVTPGSHIPIISETDARNQQPDVFLVLPWHFKPFFIEKEAAFLNSGGCLLFPLPRVEGVTG